jgi:hypothetical protein
VTVVVLAGVIWVLRRREKAQRARNPKPDTTD